MIRSPLLRLLGFALALVAGFATPASALAHGHAHEHEAEERAVGGYVDSHPETSSHGQAHDRGYIAPALTTYVVTTADRDAGDHPHSFVSAALTTKTSAAFVVLVAASVVVPVTRVESVAPPRPERSLQYRVEAAHAPPPRLRAPPALLG